MILISTIVATVVAALIMRAAVYALSSKPEVQGQLPSLGKEQSLRRAYHNAYYAHMSLSLEEKRDQSIEDDL
jgi:hypothetical protein